MRHLPNVYPFLYFLNLELPVHLKSLIHLVFNFTLDFLSATYPIHHFPRHPEAVPFFLKSSRKVLSPVVITFFYIIETVNMNWKSLLGLNNKYSL